jgi:Tfp pilus assembly protein PilN
VPLVNLIAVQRSQRRAAIRRTRAVMFAWVIEVVGCLIVLGGLMWEVDVQDSRLADLKAKSISMQPHKKAIADGEKVLSELRPRIETLTTASHFTDQWNRIFNQVSTQIPTGVWLTSVRVQEGKQEGDPTEITFLGVATDQKLVGEMMAQFNACHDLTGVKLKYTKAKQSADTMGVEFEIHAKLLTDTPKKQDEGAKNAGA